MPKKDNLKDINFDLIRIDAKERAIAKSRYEPFARYCWWLLLRDADREEIFYSRELASFAKITYPTAYRFFRDLVNLGYAEQKKAGNITYFMLVKNDGNIKLKELMPYLKKTLLKLKEKK